MVADTTLSEWPAEAACAADAQVGAGQQDYDSVLATTNGTASAVVARICTPVPGKPNQVNCRAVAFVRDRVLSPWHERDLGCVTYSQGVSFDLAPGADRLHTVLLRFCGEAVDYALVSVGLDGQLKQATPLPKPYYYGLVAGGADGAVLLADSATVDAERTTSLIKVEPSGATKSNRLAAPAGAAGACAKPAIANGSVLVALPVRPGGHTEGGTICGPATVEMWLARLDLEGHTVQQATWSPDPGRYIIGAARMHDGASFALTLADFAKDPEVVVLKDGGQVAARHKLIPPATVTSEFWFALPFQWHSVKQKTCVSGLTHGPWGAWFACATAAGWSAASTPVELTPFPQRSPSSSCPTGEQSAPP